MKATRSSLSARKLGNPLAKTPGRITRGSPIQELLDRGAQLAHVFNPLPCRRRRDGPGCNLSVQLALERGTGTRALCVNRADTVDVFGARRKQGYLFLVPKQVLGGEQGLLFGSQFDAFEQGSVTTKATVQTQGLEFVTWAC